MKSLYACLMVFLITIALPGCGTEENTLATEGATADDFARYEAELAAANSEGAYEEEAEDDEEDTE